MNDPHAHAQTQRHARMLLGLCLLAIAWGVYMRVQALDFPRVLTTDEPHFVKNARNYLAGKPDWNDHPPLGKLMMAVPMKWLGDNPRSWRLCAAGFGIANIALAFALGARLFRSRQVGLLAATFIAIDGFLIVYSRTALLDGLLTGFALACALALALPSSRVQAMLAGALLGCATSIKLSGVTLLAPLVISLWLCSATLGERWVRGGIALLCAGLVYCAQYALGLALSGQAAAPTNVFAATQALIKHHAALTQMQHPMTSYWYTWWLPTRPLPLRFDRVEGGLMRWMITLGNPLLWWSSALVMLATIGWLMRERLRALASAWPTRAALPALSDDARAAWLLCAAFVGFLSPWVLSARDSYLYHYLPCYAVSLVLFGGAAGRLYERRPRLLLGALLLVLGVSAFYAPIWGQFPIDETGYRARLFLERWRHWR
jgi:dolichyl-phosphate-mannose--protein O-mannosyl transferase